MSNRCYECFRPLSHCFCDAIPQIDNRTDILILQHIGERFHPFNTARIVQNSLARCQLVVDHNQRFARRQLPIGPDAALLFPSTNARPLNELAPKARPAQLIIVDGTWRQAQTIVRDAPQLRGLRRFRLSPASPGRYRIRREPTPQSLSTLEATVAALHELEPDTAGLGQLTAAFDQMVEGQLDYPATHAVWRRKQSRLPQQRGIPRAVLSDPKRLVIAYGESTPHEVDRSKSERLPLSWVAQRLGTSEVFRGLLRLEKELSPGALQHMRLTSDDIRRQGISMDQFRRQWGDFVGRQDTLVVYHERTLQLLRNCKAFLPRCLALKSTFGKRHPQCRSLEDLLAEVGLPLPLPAGWRADQRLEMAVSLVQHLRQVAAALPSPPP